MFFRNDVKRCETIQGETFHLVKTFPWERFRFCIHRGRNMKLIMVWTVTIIVILDQQLFQQPRNLLFWTMKKRRATPTTPTTQPEPDLATFKQLVVDSQLSKVKDPKKLPIIIFLDDWGEKLGSGWLRRLVSSGVISGKHLTGYEIKIVGHLAVILSTSGEPKWATKLSFAFKCAASTVRHAVQRYIEDLLKPSAAAAITDMPHSAPLLMQTPTSHAPAKKRSRIPEASNEREIEVVLMDVDEHYSTSLNNSSSEASPTLPKTQQHDSSDDAPQSQTRWQRIIASERGSIQNEIILTSSHFRLSCDKPVINRISLNIATQTNSRSTYWRGSL
jgi:hypothetical protein